MDFYEAKDIQKWKPGTKHNWRGKQMPVPQINWLSNVSIALTEPWQWLFYEMNQPGMTGNSFHGFFGIKTAVANSAGFSESDRRADFINGRDIGAKPPRLGKVYSFGGAILRGKVNGKYIYIETIDSNQKPPTWKDLKPKYWLYCVAKIVRYDGSTFDFPHRGGLPVLFPLVAPGGVVKVLYNHNDPNKPIPWIRAVQS